MEWTKIPTSLIINRTSDKELLAITKYQLLWAELEYQPDDSVALRYMTRNQLAIARHYLATITSNVNADIDSVIRQRGRRRKNYLKNKENFKNVTGTRTGTHTGTRTGTVSKQIRLDKIRLDNINTNTGAKPPDPLSVKSPHRLFEFGKWVAEIFDYPMDDNQQQMWFKRNCRTLKSILDFSGDNMQKAFLMIKACMDKLNENNLTFSYESVTRRAPEYYAKAEQWYLEGYRMQKKDDKFIMAKGAIQC